MLHGASFSLRLDKPVLLIDSPWMISPGEHTVWDQNPCSAETSRMWNTIAESKARLLERCGGCRVIIEGLVHGGFTDQIFMSPLRELSNSGAVAPKRVAHILNTYVLLFSSGLCSTNPRRCFRRTQRIFPRQTAQEWPSCVKKAEREPLDHSCQMPGDAFGRELCAESESSQRAEKVLADAMPTRYRPGTEDSKLLDSTGVSWMVVIC